MITVDWYLDSRPRSWVLRWPVLYVTFGPNSYMLAQYLVYVRAWIQSLRLGTSLACTSWGPKVICKADLESDYIIGADYRRRPIIASHFGYKNCSSVDVMDPRSPESDYFKPAAASRTQGPTLLLINFWSKSFTITKKEHGPRAGKKSHIQKIVIFRNSELAEFWNCKVDSFDSKGRF